MLSADRIGRYDDPMHSVSLLGLGVASDATGVGFAHLERHATRRQNRARRSRQSQQVLPEGMYATSRAVEVIRGTAEAPAAFRETLSGRAQNSA